MAIFYCVFTVFSVFVSRRLVGMSLWEGIVEHGSKPPAVVCGWRISVSATRGDNNGISFGKDSAS
jgi:hypothetical protein